jgi:hypothetical protein
MGEISQKPYEGHWAEIILHANESGIFRGLQLDRPEQAEMIEEDLWVRPGDSVEPFNAANQAIGTLILKFRDNKALEKALASQSQWLKVRVE